MIQIWSWLEEELQSDQLFFKRMFGKLTILTQTSKSGTYDIFPIFGTQSDISCPDIGPVF